MKRAALSALILLAFLLSNCSPADQAEPATPTPIQSQEGGDLSGRVISMDGMPLAGAVVTSADARTSTDGSGWFTLHSGSEPAWVTVSMAGYFPRTRAAVPGAPVLFRLSADDGKTVAIQFGGDTMFGRRFFDPNEDGDTSDGLLPTDPTVQDHLDLMMPILPLLANADLTIVNMESPLTDEPYFSSRDQRPTAYHSTKDYVFASAPSAVIALEQAGVDGVDLGNNHMYDLLESGLEDTLTILDQDGLAHFGAGGTAAEAWKPAILTARGQAFAFIGCTTIWRPEPPASSHDVTYTASDAANKGGAARCEEERLRAAVQEAKTQAEAVIVMIHGGYEYGRSPSDNVIRFTEVARSAGATLVIDHHPHVLGGYAWDGNALVAWSMGNFIFDQTVWPTFEAGLLTVYLREGRVTRATVEPLMIEGYVPHGLTGELADAVVREVAGIEAGPFVMENGAMEVDIAGNAIERSSTAGMEGSAEMGTIIQVPEGDWISNFNGSGSLVLGRDLLWIGGFENLAVDPSGEGLLLWEKGSGSIQTGEEYAYEGQNGIRLTRGSSNQDDAVTAPLHRLLVEAGTQVSLTGMARLSPGAVAILQVSWYPDTRGASSLQVTEPIAVEMENEWQAFRVDLQVPENIVAMGVYLRLPPPGSGTVSADFDNLRVIAWADPAAAFSPLYDFALLKGAGEVTYSQRLLPGAEAWFNIP